MTATAKVEDVRVPLGEDYPEIRDSVRRICANFPGAYWRELEEREAYPDAFVKALTEAGYLAALIPEEYGGAGLPLRIRTTRRLVGMTASTTAAKSSTSPACAGGSPRTFAPKLPPGNRPSMTRAWRSRFHPPAPSNRRR